MERIALSAIIVIIVDVPLAIASTLFLDKGISQILDLADKKYPDNMDKNIALGSALTAFMFIIVFIIILLVGYLLGEILKGV